MSRPVLYKLSLKLFVTIREGKKFIKYYCHPFVLFGFEYFLLISYHLNTVSIVVQ